jgi:hypothetical protein
VGFLAMAYMTYLTSLTERSIHPQPRGGTDLIFMAGNAFKADIAVMC